MGRKRFTPEFKASAVALVIEQKYSRTEAAKNLGITVSTLDAWLHKQRHLKGASSLVEEADLRKRVVELERENRRLTMERDILKKATAYFAKEQL
jgi:transposase